MKTFFLFRVAKDKLAPDGQTEDMAIVEKHDGTIGSARQLLSSDAYEAGRYRILEDTSGVVTKSVETTPKVKIAFEATRKRPRRQTAESTALGVPSDKPAPSSKPKKNR